MSLSLFKKYIVTVVIACAFSSFSFAEKIAEKPAVEGATLEQITAKMNALGVDIIAVSSSAVDGLYELLTDKGIFYISKNMQFLVDGNIYNLDNKMSNLTEQSFAALRKGKLKAFENDMIVYKAPQEKHVITVFTDTSCVYCRKLHADMANYNKQGITVRYLAFPRGGLKSSTYNLMASVWCADDPKQALDDAKKGQSVAPQTCQNTIKEQYELGLFFGVNGTPAIILEDGSLTPGYVPSARLAQMLDQKFN